MTNKQRIAELESQLAMSADARLKAVQEENARLRKLVEEHEEAEPGMKAVADLMSEDLLMFLRNVSAGGLTMTARANDYIGAATELRVLADEFQAESDEILRIQEKQAEKRNRERPEQEIEPSDDDEPLNDDDLAELDQL